MELKVAVSISQYAKTKRFVTHTAGALWTEDCCRELAVDKWHFNEDRETSSDARLKSAVELLSKELEQRLGKLNFRNRRAGSHGREPYKRWPAACERKHYFVRQVRRVLAGEP